MPFIECRDLTKQYTRGKNTITPLENLDLDIDRGEFLALMGPSGSGKTTLLNLIAGIDQPTSGTLSVNGQDTSKLSRNALAAWRADNVGYVFQLYNLVPVLTAYENVELPLLLKKLSTGERRKRVQAALELVGIAERRKRVQAALELVGIADRHDYYPRQLSGGQEQRVAIARAIVTDPKILVADEPTGDLDRKSAHAVMKLLQRLNTELECTMLMVTHDPATTEYAQRTLHLDKGRLVETPVVGEHADEEEEVAV